MLPNIFVLNLKICDFTSLKKENGTKNMEKDFYFCCNRVYSEHCLVSAGEEEGDFDSPCEYCSYYLKCCCCKFFYICKRAEMCIEESDRETKK